MMIHGSHSHSHIRMICLFHTKKPASSLPHQRVVLSTLLRPTTSRSTSTITMARMAMPLTPPPPPPPPVQELLLDVCPVLLPINNKQEVEVPTARDVVSGGGPADDDDTDPSFLYFRSRSRHQAAARTVERTKLKDGIDGFSTTTTTTYRSKNVTVTTNDDYHHQVVLRRNVPEVVPLTSSDPSSNRFLPSSPLLFWSDSEPTIAITSSTMRLLRGRRSSDFVPSKFCSFSSSIVAVLPLPVPPSTGMRYKTTFCQGSIMIEERPTTVTQLLLTLRSTSKSRSRSRSMPSSLSASPAFSRRSSSSSSSSSVAEESSSASWPLSRMMYFSTSNRAKSDDEDASGKNADSSSDDRRRRKSSRSKRAKRYDDDSRTSGEGRSERSKRRQSPSERRSDNRGITKEQSDPFWKGDRHGDTSTNANIKELRREMRQILNGRPSRNTAVDATVLLKKMMGTSSRVYEKGGKGDCINVIDCNKVISAIGKSGHKQATKMTLSVLNDMVDLYKKGNKATRPDVFAYTSVINAYARRGDVDGALKVFKMQVDDFKLANNTDAKPNIFTYSAMMNAWAKSGRSEAAAEAMKLLMTIKDLHAAGKIDAPTVITYNTAMDAHAKQGDVNGALKIFEMMSGGEVKPNLQSYNILLDAWSKSGTAEAPSEAMKLLMTIKDLHAAGEIDAPDIITYNRAMDAHAKHGDVDAVLKVFETMSDGEVKPDLLSYIILIDAWGLSGRHEAPEEAMKLLMAIKDLHARGDVDDLNTNVYNSVMNVCYRHKIHDGVLKVFQMMQDDYRAGNRNARPNILCCTTLMGSLAKSNRPEAPTHALALLATVRKMAANGELDALTSKIYCKTMDAQAKHGHIDSAVDVLQIMKVDLEAGNMNARPNIVHYTTLMDAWAESGRADAPEQAEKLFNKIEVLHTKGEIDDPPNIFTLIALYKCWNLSMRNDKQAIDRMKQLKKNIAAVDRRNKCKN